MLQRLQSFVNYCLRRIRDIRWQEKISNERLQQTTKQDPILTQIQKRKWGWVCYTIRKPANNITRQVLKWYTQGKRKRERTKTHEDVIQKWN